VVTSNDGFDAPPVPAPASEVLPVTISGAGTSFTRMQKLTEFQKNILNVLVGEPKYGVEVKKALEEYYGEEINHGRLYPNLDKLADRGYVDKLSLDDRKNEYAVTDEARAEIRDEIAWRVESYIDGSDDREKELLKAINGEK
jgi:DNA-binding PadR family transcriptional regulator